MKSFGRVRILNLIGQIFLACILLVSCSRRNEVGFKPGGAPPPVDLVRLDGTKTTLDEFKGKVVLINFWATWCSPCVDELPALERLYNRLKDRGFIVVGVSIDDQKTEILEFQRRFGLTYPLLIDQSGEGKLKYGLSGVPESFFLDKEGRFILFPDPEDSGLVVRIIGPRDWSSAAFEATLKSILN